MNKLSRKEMKLLKDLAATLPKTYYEASEVHRMKGSVILANKDIDVSKLKGPIKPDSIYEVNVPTKHLVNHNNRLVTAFHNGGLAAVEQYANEVMELVESQFKTKAVIPAELATC